MKTDRTTKALLGIIVCLSLWSLQACMALQEGSSDCSFSSLEACRMQAEQGNADAQFSLGVAYLDGRGVPENDAEAVRWFRMAAEQGQADAQFNLGRMYVDGQGVVQDDVRAYLWFNLAAAASQGIRRDISVRNRDMVADRLSPADRGVIVKSGV